MKISLILTAYNRQRELDRFALSLADQRFDGEVEVIFVSQGPARFEIPAPARAMITVRERIVSGPIALAEARNIAIEDAEGEIIGFPDDDCWYEPDLLAKVAGYYQEHPITDCLCTEVRDPERHRSLGANRPNGEVRVSYWSIFRMVNSNGIFVRANVMKRLGRAFNEKLGVGTGVGSGEEIEFAARVLDLGCTITYVGRVVVYHEVRGNLAEGRRKVCSYGFGFGYVNALFLKDGHFEVLPYFLEIIARSGAGAVRHLFADDQRMLYLERLRGILSGVVASLRGQ